MEVDQSLSRRERERLRRREAMLEAARTVFAEKGYGAATLDEIAERAEFGKGTLYNYFEGGKEELLFAVLDDLYDSIRALARNNFGDRSWEDRPIKSVFHAYITDVVQRFMDERELFMLLIKEAHRMAYHEDPEKVEYFQEQTSRLVDLMVPAIEAAIERGSLRSFPPKAIAHAVQGNIHGYLMQECRKEHRSSGSAQLFEDAEAAADFLTIMLFEGLEVDPTSE